ncbi:MAG TPA: cyclodeaminase/cyclohydrolase family protein [Candidatus Thalassarchaeaceae archaeon]|nr:cyclodeaminase/cyclohydrolase family protein [Candidatus Thalassarchaeaceae archaeon]
MNEGYADVLSRISSSSPTPGGGSVAALSLAHAHALGMMVSRLTLGKEKWSEGHNSASEVIELSTKGIDLSLLLADEDASAFDAVMDSYRLPRDNELQKSIRAEAIESSTINAAFVPLKIMRASSDFLQSIMGLSRTGNPNALTDLLASSELAYASSKIASYNVQINLDSLDDTDEKKDIAQEMESLLKASLASSTTIESIIMERLKWD